MMLWLIIIVLPRQGATKFGRFGVKYAAAIQRIPGRGMRSFGQLSTPFFLSFVVLAAAAALLTLCKNPSSSSGHTHKDPPGGPTQAKNVSHSGISKGIKQGARKEISLLAPS